MVLRPGRVARVRRDEASGADCQLASPFSVGYSTLLPAGDPRGAAGTVPVRPGTHIRARVRPTPMPLVIGEGDKGLKTAARSVRYDRRERHACRDKADLRDLKNPQGTDKTCERRSRARSVARAGRLWSRQSRVSVRQRPRSDLAVTAARPHRALCASPVRGSVTSACRTSRALSSPAPPYGGLALLGDPQIYGDPVAGITNPDLRFIFTRVKTGWGV
jgi:hypothetical protein